MYQVSHQGAVSHCKKKKKTPSAAVFRGAGELVAPLREEVRENHLER